MPVSVRELNLWLDKKHFGSAEYSILYKSFPNLLIAF